MPKKLESGYYIIENELGETVKRKQGYNTALFEFRAAAVLTAKRFKACGLDQDFTF
jgi:hypothetical protein